MPPLVEPGADHERKVEIVAAGREILVLEQRELKVLHSSGAPHGDHHVGKSARKRDEEPVGATRMIIRLDVVDEQAELAVRGGSGQGARRHPEHSQSRQSLRPPGAAATRRCVQRTTSWVHGWPPPSVLCCCARGQGVALPDDLPVG